MVSFLGHLSITQQQEVALPTVKRIPCGHAIYLPLLISSWHRAIQKGKGATPPFDKNQILRMVFIYPLNGLHFVLICAFTDEII